MWSVTRYCWCVKMLCRNHINIKMAAQVNVIVTVKMEGASQGGNPALDNVLWKKLKSAEVTLIDFSGLKSWSCNLIHKIWTFKISALFLWFLSTGQLCIRSQIFVWISSLKIWSSRLLWSSKKKTVYSMKHFYGAKLDFRYFFYILLIVANRKTEEKFNLCMTTLILHKIIQPRLAYV